VVVSALTLVLGGAAGLASSAQAAPSGATLSATSRTPATAEKPATAKKPARGLFAGLTAPQIRTRSLLP
jgi:hypothetical protein